MNLRRYFLIALGPGLTGTVAMIRAQTPAGPIKRVGVLAEGSRSGAERVLKPFFDEMSQLGWVEGRRDL